MKYQVTADGDTAEALGAYSGYRIRLIATRRAASPPFVLSVTYRGSESLPESAVPVPEVGFDSAVDAFEAGYAHAVAWIDRRNEEDAG